LEYIIYSFFLLFQRLGLAIVSKIPRLFYITNCKLQLLELFIRYIQQKLISIDMAIVVVVVALTKLGQQRYFMILESVVFPVGKSDCASTKFSI
jgi:hypothetical protein